MKINDTTFLKKIFEVAGVMKSSRYDMVVVKDDHIIVINNDYTRLVVDKLQYSTGLDFICNFSALENYFKKGDEFIYDDSIPEYYKIIDLYNKYMSYQAPVFEFNEIKEEMPEMIGIKSDDGYIKVKFGKHLVIFFAGMFSVSKNDLASVDIYESGKDDIFIVRYDIYKHKLKSTYSVFFCCLNLCK